MKRLNREYILSINDKISVKYGCVNVLNPVVLYVTCKTWISPRNDNQVNDMYDVIKSLKNALKSIMHDNDSFENNFIFDFDFSANTLQKDKKNFLSIEFLFKQNEKQVEEAKKMKTKMQKVFGNVFNEFTDNLIEKSFLVSKGKH